jgi:hypothetical protein
MTKPQQSIHTKESIMENRNPNKKLWKHILKLWPEAMEYEDLGVTTEQWWGRASS